LHYLANKQTNKQTKIEGAVTAKGC